MILYKKAAFKLLLLILFPAVAHLSWAGVPKKLNSQAKLIILFVVDGLRPDLITEKNTPNIYRLSQQGVFFENSHAIFPTVTRVNSAAIATASYPIHSGIVSNSIFIPAMNPTASFTTGDYHNLRKLDEITNGKLLLCKSWAQRLAENDFKPAAISSGSSGSAFLLNHRAPQGIGILINGWFEPDSIVAFPKEVNERILQKFGPAPDVGQAANYNDKVNWTTRVLTDYLLTEEKPDVIYCWITEPDHTQHHAGIGAPQTLETIRNSDRNIGLVIKRIKELALYPNTDILVTSDHGFSTYNYSVNVENELIKAGLKKSQGSGDVVLAGSGESVLIHVKNRNKKKIAQIVQFLQAQKWIGVIFTAGKGKAPRHFHGSVDGTFSLDILHQPSDGRGPDILLTFPWSSAKNKYGFPGMDYSNGGEATGPKTGVRAGHGSMSPLTVRNTMIAWGVDFKSGVRSRVP
ncbi:MAG: alkaline phosphatase family protein, partial [FCB group bacterium]|nr:alkaline phosphatase family protein [FCB group bacterium]